MLLYQTLLLPVCMVPEVFIAFRVKNSYCHFKRFLVVRFLDTYRLVRWLMLGLHATLAGYVIKQVRSPINRERTQSPLYNLPIELRFLEFLLTLSVIDAYQVFLDQRRKRRKSPVRPEEVFVVCIVLSIWSFAIYIFFNQWGKQ